jgi:hypothetical protein
VKACPAHLCFSSTHRWKLCRRGKIKDTTSAEECSLFTNADIYSRRWQQVNRRVRARMKEHTRSPSCRDQRASANGRRRPKEDAESDAGKCIAMLPCRIRFPITTRWLIVWPCLDAKFFFEFHYAKRRFLVTLKYWHMHRVLNVDEIKTNCTVLLFFTRRTFWV